MTVPFRHCHSVCCTLTPTSPGSPRPTTPSQPPSQGARDGAARWSQESGNELVCKGRWGETGGPGQIHHSHVDHCEQAPSCQGLWEVRSRRHGPACTHLAPRVGCWAGASGPARSSSWPWGLWGHGGTSRMHVSHVLLGFVDLLIQFCPVKCSGHF